MAGIKTVLLVEDDRFIGEMYARSLRMAGYEVQWVVNGDDASKAAVASSFDLILLDIMLPEKQGPEILQELRGAKDLIPKSRVIVLTNYDQDEESRLAMQNKADGYLIKADITPRKLLEIIEQMIPVQ